MGKYRAKMFLWWCLRCQYCYGDILCDILDIQICLWWKCCFRNILSCSFAIDMSWVNVLLWKCIGWQNCYEDNIVIGFSMEKILLWLMIWVKVLLWGCLKSILLWRWLSLQYCYGDGLGYSIAIEMPLVTFLLQIHVCMTAWRQLGEKFGILLWSKNVYFLPCQGMIDFWVYTNCPL